MTIKVGTSGFGIARSKYTGVFECVEVQHTFYQPPRISTLERWREEAPPDFEFVIKAWQLITHDAKSPTYRRLKKELSEGEREEAGYFRATPIVMEAWEVTLACALALRARTILFQCPASFKQTKENISNLRKFFKTVARSSKRTADAHPLNFAWEPRGDWDSKVVKAICDELGLWHAVDPFVAATVTPDKLYFRLHGRGGWRYEYDDEEMRELAAKIPARKSDAPVLPESAEDQPSYVFFNNVRMTQDALRFREILAEGHEVNTTTQQRG